MSRAWQACRFYRRHWRLHARVLRWYAREWTGRDGP